MLYLQRCNYEQVFLPSSEKDKNKSMSEMSTKNMKSLTKEMLAAAKEKGAIFRSL